MFETVILKEQKKWKSLAIDGTVSGPFSPEIPLYNKDDTTNLLLLNNLSLCYQFGGTRTVKYYSPSNFPYYYRTSSFLQM